MSMKHLSRQNYFQIIKNRIEGDKPILNETIYYLSYYDNIGNQKQIIKWNWAAFFWDGAWMFYRRMFGYGCVVLVLNLVFFHYLKLSLNEPTRATSITIIGLYLCSKFLLGTFANTLYASFVRSCFSSKKIPGFVEGQTILVYLGLITIIVLAGLL